jgi:hypothetical protein
MTRPASAKTPLVSDAADSSGRLLRALLSSAGLSIRGEVVSAQADPPAPKKRARRRSPTPSR